MSRCRLRWTTEDFFECQLGWSSSDFYCWSFVTSMEITNFKLEVFFLWIPWRSSMWSAIFGVFTVEHFSKEKGLDLLKRHSFVCLSLVSVAYYVTKPIFSCWKPQFVEGKLYFSDEWHIFVEEKLYLPWNTYISLRKLEFARENIYFSRESLNFPEKAWVFFEKTSISYVILSLSLHFW